MFSVFGLVGIEPTPARSGRAGYARSGRAGYARLNLWATGGVVERGKKRDKQRME
jgi:hypothetical protein